MSIDGLNPLEKQEYMVKIQNLLGQNVISSKGILDIFGYTEEGDFVWAPDSFSMGYKAGLLPRTERPSFTINILDIFGQLSDNSWVFVPSYKKGITYGVERQDELKFSILAAGEKRIFQELQTQQKVNTDIGKQLKDAQERIQELERRSREREH